MIKRILTSVILAPFVFTFTAIGGSDSDSKYFKTNCKSGICVEDSSIVLTDNDVCALKNIYKEEERPNLEFTDIHLQTVIPGSVYLLIARKPDYYGIKIVLSKDSNKWMVLKKVKSIE